MRERHDSPFSVESTHITFKDSDVGAEVTRNLWAMAREYRESFDVYGATRSFEWTQIADENHVIHTGEIPVRVDVPDYAHLLPEEIRSFTTAGVYTAEGEETHRSFVQGGGHGGSHPHLVHQLLMSILGEREAYPNARQAANITCAGILSHESALQGGVRVELPEWTFEPDSKPIVIPLDESIEPQWANAPLPDSTGGFHVA